MREKHHQKIERKKEKEKEAERSEGRICRGTVSSKRVEILRYTFSRRKEDEIIRSVTSTPLFLSAKKTVKELSLFSHFCELSIDFDRLPGKNPPHIGSHIISS